MKGKVKMMITRYKKLAAYEVIDAIEKGMQVKCLDRANLNVFSVNEMNIVDAFNLKQCADASETHKGGYDYFSDYEFWAVVSEPLQEVENDTV